MSNKRVGGQTVRRWPAPETIVQLGPGRQPVSTNFRYRILERQEIIVIRINVRWLHWQRSELAVKKHIRLRESASMLYANALMLVLIN